MRKTTFMTIKKGIRHMKSLHKIPFGQTVTVVRVSGDYSVKRRIMDMGITKGTPITVRKAAPLGDPLEIGVRDYVLTIRKADAKNIIVE